MGEVAVEDLVRQLQVALVAGPFDIPLERGLVLFC
jgi:hypothetical protein